MLVFFVEMMMVGDHVRRRQVRARSSFFLSFLLAFLLASQRESGEEKVRLVVVVVVFSWMLKL